jgi:hypothetical protein
MPAPAPLLKRLSFLPLAWTGLFALFVAVKRLQYPSYAVMLIEDPKDLGMQLPHDSLFFAVIYILLIHPFVWLSVGLAWRLGKGHWPRRRELGLFGAAT